MDIQAKKLNLIQWLVNLKDERLIRKIEAIQAEDTDFWNNLNEDQKKEIKQAIQELEEGKRYSYEQVMSKHR